MKKLKWTWQKIVTLITGFLGIGTLVSCYGVPPRVEDIYGKVTGEIDGVEQPIPGIYVESLSAETKTDENGYYEIETYIGMPVIFKDTDGSQNGQFKTKEIHFDNSESREQNIVLTPGIDEAEDSK